MKITEEKNNTVYHIPLGKSGNYAAIYKEDYDYLIQLEVSKTWNDGTLGYVTAYCKSIPGTRVAIARVLMDAGEGETVRYLDGDRTNLRRNNLIKMKDCRAKRRDRDYLRLNKDKTAEVEVAHV
jgi:hypothetical protein